MNEYASPRFEFVEFIRELATIQGLAHKRFLNSSADGVFSRLKSSLEQLKNSKQQNKIYFRQKHS